MKDKPFKRRRILPVYQELLDARALQGGTDSTQIIQEDRDNAESRMTQLLEQAFTEASELSPEAQDTIATFILKESKLSSVGRAPLQIARMPSPNSPMRRCPSIGRAGRSGFCDFPHHGLGRKSVSTAPQPGGLG